MFEIRIIVDNLVAYGSEFWGEHGFSVLINSSGELTLFDVGASEEVFMHNLRICEEDLSKLRRIVISHGHYDHTGGLETLLKTCSKVGIKPEIYINPFAFNRKYSKGEKGYIYRGMRINRDFIYENAIMKDAIVKGREEKEEGKEKEIGEGMYLLTGVVQKYSFENIEGNFYIRKDEKDENYTKDDFQDEISLVLESEGKRYVIVGCAHSGIVNIISSAEEKFGKISGFLGGTHLVNAKVARMQNTADILKKMGIERAYLSHCSGMRAVAFLSSILEGSYISQTSAGMIIKL